MSGVWFVLRNNQRTGSCFQFPDITNTSNEEAITMMVESDEAARFEEMTAYHQPLQ